MVNIPRIPTSATWPFHSQNTIIAPRTVCYEQATVERERALFKMAVHDMLAPALQSVAWVALRDSGKEISSQTVEFYIILIKFLVHR